MRTPESFDSVQRTLADVYWKSLGVGFVAVLTAIGVQQLASKDDLEAFYAFNSAHPKPVWEFNDVTTDIESWTPIEASSALVNLGRVFIGIGVATFASFIVYSISKFVYDSATKQNK